MPTFDDRSISASSSQDDAAMEMGTSRFLRGQLSETNMDDILASHSARLGGKVGPAPRRTSADLLDAPDMGGSDGVLDEERGRTATGRRGDDASTRAEPSVAGDSSVAPSEADRSMVCPRASAAIVIEDILDGSDRCAPDGFMGWGPDGDDATGGDGASPPSSPAGEVGSRLDGSTASGRRGSIRSLRFDRLWDDRGDDGTQGKGRHANGDLGGKGGHAPRASCRSVLRANIRRVSVCLVFLVGVAVTVGTLATMVPIWMAGEGNAIGSEVESGAGGRNNNVMLDTSGGRGPVSIDTTLASGGGGKNFGLDPSYESAGGSPSSTKAGPPPRPAVIPTPTPPTPDLGGFLPPPPDLKSVCGRRAISTPAGRDRCLSACVPSRCCLVPQGSPYTIWSRATLDPYEPDESSLGTTVFSCFRRNAKMCVEYYDSCGALGDDALIPRGVPTAGEMKDMGEAGLLDLAERVNHACGRRENDVRQCAALCEGRRCCFAGPGGPGSQGGGGPGGPSPGGGGSGPGPTSGYAGTASYQTDTYYDDFYPTVSPSRSPRRRTPYPTPTFGSVYPNELDSYMPTGSQPPTPSVYLSRRRLGEAGEEEEKGRRNLRDDFGHMGIPGDEDFKFFTSDPFKIGQGGGPGVTYPGQQGAAAPGAAGKGAPAWEDATESCADDPMGFCTVFAGCARYFGG